MTPTQPPTSPEFRLDASSSIVTSFPLLVAQDAPRLAGQAPEAAPSTAREGAAGGAKSGGGSQGAGDAASSPLMYLLPVVLVLWVVMMIFGQRRDGKKKQTMLGSLKKHDRVQTVGGAIGSIVEIKPDVVVLKVDEQSNTRMTFAKSAIVGVVKEAASTPGSGDASKDSSSSAKSA